MKIRNLQRGGFTVVEVLFATVALGLVLGVMARLTVVGGTRFAVMRVEAMASRLERNFSEQYRFCAYGLLPTDPVTLTGFLYQPYDQSAHGFKEMAPWRATISRTITGGGTPAETSEVRIQIVYEALAPVGATINSEATSATRTRVRDVTIRRRPGTEL